MKTVKILIATLALWLLCPTISLGAISSEDMMSGLLQAQIIEAIPENTSVNIKREDFFVMLAKAMLNCDPGSGLPESTYDVSAIFADAGSISSKNYPYIMYLYQKNVLRGSALGQKLYVRPIDSVTRQDAAVFLGRWLGIDPLANISVQARFTDAASISNYACDTVYQLYELGIISGYGDGSFRPLRPITFGDAAALVYKTLMHNQSELKTYFGSGIIGNFDGADYESRFALPGGLCLDNNGSLIVFDTYNAAVKRIGDNGAETILGFRNPLGEYGLTKPLYLDGDKNLALLGRPTGGLYTPNNDLYIVDSANHAIRLLREGSDNKVYTFAGGVAGFADGLMGNAKFNSPTAIALGPEGNLYVADTQNHCIRQISPEGKVTTIAGTPQKAGFSDAAADKALFCEPSGIAVDEFGAIYVADTGNQLIRKIEGDVVTTLAGAVAAKSAGDDYRPGGFTDGPALSARFNFPRGLCYANGNLFIADTGNHAVRMLNSAGTVVTIAGNGEPGDADGPPAMAMMNKPSAVVFHQGMLYIADTLNNKIKIVPVNQK